MRDKNAKSKMRDKKCEIKMRDKNVRCEIGKDEPAILLATLRLEDRNHGLA